jgi:hypothetical protein
MLNVDTAPCQDHIHVSNPDFDCRKVFILLGKEKLLHRPPVAANSPAIIGLSKFLQEAVSFSAGILANLRWGF